MDSSRYWLALHKIPSINIRTLKHALSKVSHVAELFSSDRQKLISLKLPQKSIEAILKFDWNIISSEVAWLDQPSHHILTFDSPIYPKHLKEIAAPPLLLFVLGDINCLQMPQIAIVGSRTPTHTGLSITEEFTNQLIKAGLVITSGLAYGIDKTAHQSALNHKGKTIAVLGSGVSKIYPTEHITLARRIAEEGGAIISEFSLNQPPLRSNFPKRNRIISGLSLGVLVIEAAQKSGSLITARQALEANREVFAIPGSIRNMLSAGCHKLIQQGAKLVSQVNDILEEIQLPLMVQPSLTRQNKKSHLVLDSAHQKLLKCIGYEPTSVNVLVKRSELTVEKVTAMLIALEINGHIQSTLRGYLKI